MPAHLVRPESLRIDAHLRQRLEGAVEVIEDAVALTDAAISSLKRTAHDEDDVLTVRELAQQLPRIVRAIDRAKPFEVTQPLCAVLRQRLTPIAGDPPRSDRLAEAITHMRVATTASEVAVLRGGGKGLWWRRTPRWSLFVDRLRVEGRPDVPLDRLETTDNAAANAMVGARLRHTFRSYPYPSLTIDARTDERGTAFARAEGLLFVPRRVEAELEMFGTGPTFNQVLAMMKHLTPRAFTQAAAGERAAHWYARDWFQLDWRAFVVNVSEDDRPALSIAFRADSSGRGAMQELKALLR